MISFVEQLQLNQEHWDTVVIGAGVAGSSFAIRSSQTGKKVLLVEASSFPREKVCGGCLNTRAQSQLSELGVLDELLQNQAVSLYRLRIQVNEKTATWNVPQMLSVRRSTLDATLVRRAVHCGTRFVDSTHATVMPVDALLDKGGRRVRLRNKQTGMNILVSAPLIVVAAGLSRSPLPRNEPWEDQVMPDSRVGVHCLIPKDSLSDAAFPIEIDSRTLNMTLRHHGYVGVCETDGGWIDFAAAIEPKAIREQGGIANVIASILHPNHPAFLELLQAQSWSATPLLTRSSLVAAQNRLFLLGDSVGYVEPFTGEGMSWAFEGAKELFKLTNSLYEDNTNEIERKWNLWNNTHRQTRQRVCKWVANQTRHTLRAKIIVKTLDWMPRFRNLIIQKAMQ
ncbi:MAG: NAD(P)/FAD-dependent oxidoreductase [Pirellula sp.]|jgi:flavin-dependent dehydrogenase